MFDGKKPEAKNLVTLSPNKKKAHMPAYLRQMYWMRRARPTATHLIQASG
jgi:hypothetical protein